VTATRSRAAWHPRRGLDRAVHESLEPGERDDLVESGADLSPAPEQHAVDVDVLRPVNRVEAGAPDQADTRPRTETSPVVGLRMPAMTLSSVDFELFEPTI
jgi:hypothetical protein